MPREGVAASMSVSGGVGGIVDKLAVVDVVEGVSMGSEVELDIARTDMKLSCSQTQKMSRWSQG